MDLKILYQLDQKYLRKKSVKELVEFIIEYPSVLKRPIIINENELQVGYNNEDITIFLPKELRNIEAFSGFDSDDALNIKYSKNK